jgi:KUP system potassium uptake protein
LVLGFRSSTNLASAYGIAVTTTMVITSILANYVARERWGWSVWRASLVSGAFLAVDLAFFGANVIKIPSGGWFPLIVAALIYIIMTTWSTGRQLVVRKLAEHDVSLADFFARMAEKPPTRVSGTGVFMTARPEGAPPILVHHLTHNKALNEQIVLLTVSMVEVPTVPLDTSISVEPLAGGFWRVVAKYGYMDQPDVPAALERARQLGLQWTADDTTYYMAHLTLFAHSESRVGMSEWRDKLFVFISRNARAATSFFHIPPDRVIEIGIQLEL